MQSILQFSQNFDTTTEKLFRYFVTSPPSFDYITALARLKGSLHEWTANIGFQLKKLKISIT